MSVKKYDAETEKQLESDLQSLEADISETSARISEFEGKDLSDDTTMADRNELLAKHTRLTNDHSVLTSQLSGMRLLKPADKLPTTAVNPEIEEFDAMLRGKGNSKMEISIEAIASHQRDRMISRSDINTNADGAAGGAIQSLTQPTLVDSLKAYGAALGVIPIIETATGSEMEWPVTDNSNQSGEMLADEGTSITEGDAASIGKRMLSTKVFSSKYLDISNTLLQDAVFDVVTYASTLCARRLGRAISSKIVTAPLTDGIDGFKSIATQVEIDSKTGITFPDELVELVHKIDRAYLVGENGIGSNLMAGSGLTQMNGYIGFIGSYEMLRVLKTAKDTQQRPVWQPNFIGGAPSMVMGHPFLVVDELDGFGTQNNVPLMFGNFNYFQGRFARTIEVESFYDSGTALARTTRFLGTARFGMRSIIQLVSNKNPALAAAVLPA